MYPYPGSSLPEEELAEEIPGYRRRKAIIERRLDDFRLFRTFLLLRPTADGEIPQSLKAGGFEITDIEDRLVKCFWCRADGWLGVGQIETPTSRTICLCCQATMMALGILPGDERNRTYMIASPDVPKRLPPTRP